MSEFASPTDDQLPPLLDELMEPLDTAAPAEPLPADAVVHAPDGRSFRILALLKSEPQTNLYSAAVNGDDQCVWLREATTESTAARLCHEAEVLEGFECAMFPRVLACFVHDGKTYLATEPLPAETTLADLLATDQPPFPQTLSFLTQIAFALTRLHAHGWAHLGLRPAAITLSRPVKILDLSYATRLGEMPPSAFYYAGYSPPELLTGEPVDARADVYAIGALLYRALSGKPVAETGAELNTWKPPTPTAGVPQILHRCLGNRETRYATMQTLHGDLLRLARRHMPIMQYSLAAATTIGLEPTRTTNQDAYAYITGRLESEEGGQAWAVVCVADGMGGMAGGELASAVAVKTVIAEAATALVRPQPPSAEEHAQMLKPWTHAANAKVCAALEAQGARGGTTLLCASLVDRRLAIAHVGDCRLYLLQEGAARLLTRDHSLAMAQVLQGELTTEAVRRHPDRNKVTRSLGDRQPLPEYFVDTLQQMTGNATMEVRAGDVLLLCSDGLWEPVLEDEMLGVLHQHAPDLNASAKALLTLALQRGAPDNATVVLLRMDDIAAP